MRFLSIKIHYMNIVKWLLPYCCLLTSVVQGAPADFLAAVAKAAHTYPLSQAVAREVKGSEGELSAARWQRYPSPSLESVTPQDIENNSRVNRLAIEQPLFAGGRIDAGIDGAQARLGATEARYRQTLQDTALRLTGVWFEWQRNLSRQMILQDSVDAHRKLKEQIERRVAEGVSPSADLTLAVARLSQTQSELAQVQSATRNAYAQLLQLSGDQIGYFTVGAAAEWGGLASLPLPSPQWKAAAITRDPQLERFSAEIQAGDADVRARKGQLWPSVSLRYQHDYSGPNPGGGVFLQVRAQPGAGLSTLSGINAAAARRDATLEQRNAALRDLEQQLDIDLADNASARERLEVASLLRSSTQEVAASYARQFVAGRKSWLDVLNAVREAASARLSIVDAQALLGQSWWRLRIRAFGIEAAQGNI